MGIDRNKENIHTLIFKMPQQNHYETVYYSLYKGTLRFVFSQYFHPAMHLRDRVTSGQRTTQKFC